MWNRGCASTDGPANWSMITTAYTPPPFGHLYRSLSLCSRLCLSTFPLNTCYYCTADLSKAWCVNSTVLTEEYKMIEGHWNLCAHVFWTLVCVCVKQAFSIFRERHGMRTHIWIRKAYPYCTKTSLSRSLCVSQGGRRWIGGGLGGSDQRESALVKGGVGSSPLSPATVASALGSTSGQSPARIPRVENNLSCSLPPPFTPRQCHLPQPFQCSPMFDSDPDQNPSSDESDESGRDSWYISISSLNVLSSWINLPEWLMCFIQCLTI